MRRLAIYQDLAAGRSVEQSDDVEQGTLSRARGTGDRNRISGCGLQVDSAQDRDVALSRGKVLCQLFHSQFGWHSTLLLVGQGADHNELPTVITDPQSSTDSLRSEACLWLGGRLGRPSLLDRSREFLSLFHIAFHGLVTHRISVCHDRREVILRAEVHQLQQPLGGSRRLVSDLFLQLFDFAGVLPSELFPVGKSCILFLKRLGFFPDDFDFSVLFQARLTSKADAKHGHCQDGSTKQ